jgi:glycosyltransferase involved in cell wall biosynthesis
VKIATLGNASAVHTQRWVAHFRSRGHDVRLWSLERGPDAIGAERLPRMPLPGFLRYPLAVPALARAMDRFAPDLVDAHYVPNYGLMGAMCGRRPLAVTAWGSDLLIAAGRDPLQRMRARHVLTRADVVLADGDNLAEAARAIGAPRDRVVTIPWGIDLARYRPGLEREAGLLLSTRMHEAVYDIPTLFRGVEPLMRARPDLHLVIAGDGSLRPELHRLAASLLPLERVTFTGRLDDGAMASWLGRAEVFLSASRSDSTSVSLLEAMAAGALPVVSDIEGNRAWVGEGDGARLFPVGDAQGVTRAVERALGDPAWAASARSRNRRVVEERADWSTNMARVERLFERLARGEPPGGAS